MERLNNIIGTALGKSSEYFQQSFTGTFLFLEFQLSSVKLLQGDDLVFLLQLSLCPPYLSQGWVASLVSEVSIFLVRCKRQVLSVETGLANYWESGRDFYCVRLTWWMMEAAMTTMSDRIKIVLMMIHYVSGESQTFLAGSSADCQRVAGVSSAHWPGNTTREDWLLRPRKGK